MLDADGLKTVDKAQALAVPRSKTPIGYLLERRTEAECEALLAEALQRLRTHRQSRARGPHSWS